MLFYSNSWSIIQRKLFVRKHLVISNVFTKFKLFTTSPPFGKFNLTFQNRRRRRRWVDILSPKKNYFKNKILFISSAYKSNGSYEGIATCIIECQRVAWMIVISRRRWVNILFSRKKYFNASEKWERDGDSKEREKERERE